MKAHIPYASEANVCKRDKHQFCMKAWSQRCKTLKVTIVISQLVHVHKLWKVHIDFEMFGPFSVKALQQCVCFVFNFSVISRSIWKPPVVRFANPHANISFPQISHCYYFACCAFSFILYWLCGIGIIPSSILPYIFATGWCHSLEYPTGLGQSCSTEDNPLMYACCSWPLDIYYLSLPA
jgi:hypothetical protein